MTKSLIVAALLSTMAVASFAQASAPADAASTPAKKAHVKKAHKAHKAASATNPEASPMKNGDGK